MQFQYRGINRDGRRVRGKVSAASAEAAKQTLKNQSIYYESLKPLREWSWKPLGNRTMPNRLLNGFAKELSSYLSSGMTLPTALKLMENQHKEERRYAAFLEEVRSGIDEGQSLYQALAKQTSYQLPDFFLHSLNVAGQSGKLPEVLRNMGDFFSIQSHVRKQVANAMAYPLFIFVVAIGMTAFLITYIVPKITGIFQDTGQELPRITRMVLGLSDFLSSHYLVLLLGLIALVILFRLSYTKAAPFRRLVDHTLLRVPVIGSIIQNHELARFSYILSLMLDSGVSYAQAVQLASSTFGNSALKELFDLATRKVVEGNKLSNALQLSGARVLKRNFMQSLALGEESSEVASVMSNLSKLYSEENEDRIKMLLSLLEPAMMLLIGAIVGVIVMAMLLPIFTMNLGTAGKL